MTCLNATGPFDLSFAKNPPPPPFFFSGFAPLARKKKPEQRSSVLIYPGFLGLEVSQRSTQMITDRSPGTSKL
jgi:hypothetical protein